METFELTGKGFSSYSKTGGHRINSDWEKIALPFNPRMGYEAPGDQPSIDQVYDACVRLGWSAEQTIRILLKLYWGLHFVRYGYLAEKVLTIGFIGYRGSGKSASATALLINDWLIQGKRVWSNTPIAVKIKYRDAEIVLSSEPLPKLELLEMDEDFHDGCVFIDEVNMEIAESSRYMSGTNLAFSYMVQQMRKRDLSVVWTAQQWNSVDSRLRWQSDFIVWCQDSFFTGSEYPPGWFSTWRIMDISGMSGQIDFEQSIRMHYLLDLQINLGRCFIRPYWGCYNTTQLQGLGEYSKKVLEKQNQTVNDPPINIEPENLGAFLDKCEADNAGAVLYKKELWTEYGITGSHADKVRLGSMISNRQWGKGRDTRGRFWVVPFKNKSS